ncbi:MAG: aldo/keto reductase [Candidatus Latescibacterota bacterium]
MDRRAALRRMATLAAGLVAPAAVRGQSAASDHLGPVLSGRALGSTGEMVTLLGLGGWHLAEKMDRREAEAVVETAIAGGVRFFDTAESYGDGESERRYGEFLVPRYRDHVFLMTKTTARDAATARQHLEGSLRRLRTDHVDLWQMHSVQDPSDVDQRLAGGVLDAMLEMREAGKTRHIGFTGHARTAAHRRVLERTRDFATCQLPLNVADPAYDSFVAGVLPELVERRMGVLAMKTLANGRFFRAGLPEGAQALVPGHVSVAQALHFVWSLPVSVLISGPDNRQQMQEKIELARAFAQLSAQERQLLIDRAADFGGPEVEYYKA